MYDPTGITPSATIVPSRAAGYGRFMPFSSIPRTRGIRAAAVALVAGSALLAPSPLGAALPSNSADLSAQLRNARAEQVRLQDEIDRLEEQIPALRRQVTELGDELKRRAVLIYQRGSASSLPSALDTRSLQGANRAMRLAARAAEHDDELARHLRETSERLARDERALRHAKEQQDRLVVDLTTSGARASDVRIGATRCPVAGAVRFRDDFGAPRPGGRAHQGIDMSASTGTPLVAVTDGRATHDTSALGGMGIWLVGTDANSYYYAHLSRWEGEGRFVAAGDVIGYVGSTGNATSPHLHFELHPGPPATRAIDPYPRLVAICR